MHYVVWILGVALYGAIFGMWIYALVHAMRRRLWLWAFIVLILGTLGAVIYLADHYRPAKRAIPPMPSIPSELPPPPPPRRA